jgi:hypothetical protein
MSTNEKLQNTNLNSNYGIPLSTGLEYINNYRNSNFFNDLNGLKAFYIPATEIAEFINEYKGEGVGMRAYLGLVPATAELKLVFVATELEDKDGIIVHRDKIDNARVFDLTTPCPADCDTASPLFTGQIQNY